MCGRFILVAKAKDLAQHFGIPLEEAIEMCQADEVARLNVAPTQNVLFVRNEQGERHLAQGRWGLVPSWTKALDQNRLTFNARLETAARLPTFRSAWRQRRCIVPATGFWEWQDVGTKKKLKHKVSPTSGPFLAMAGLWDSWTNPSDGEVLESTTILTTDAAGAIRQIHHRMPVLLATSDWDAWLNPEFDDPAGLPSLRAESHVDELRTEPAEPPPPASDRPRQGTFWD
ncbi:MAG TPA: SOS response-associated peptidase [Gemmatales bacterium]|nr:SOS response-associated peptidase [Gemmatales bacterium]HMP58744.1 SOS response-associated peptidase [Gemmatales bacterium]